MKKFAIAAASVFMLAGVAACGESAADKAAVAVLKKRIASQEAARRKEQERKATQKVT